MVSWLDYFSLNKLSVFWDNVLAKAIGFYCHGAIWTHKKNRSDYSQSAGAMAWSKNQKNHL